MTDLKEIFERMLAAPPPPRYDSAQVLAAAHRAQRRARLAAAGTFGALAMAVAVAVALPVVLRQDTAPMPPAASASTVTTVPAPAPPAPAPAPADLTGHGSRLQQTLVDALPAGVTVGPGAPSAWILDGEKIPEIEAAAVVSVPVAAPAGAGLLSAVVAVDGAPAPAADPCAPRVTARLDWYAKSAIISCEVVTIDAVPVRVTIEQDPTMGTVLRAVRLLDGGFVSVQQTARPSEPQWQPDLVRPWRERDSRHWLAEPSLLTTQQLAALAADPALLP